MEQSKLSEELEKMECEPLLPVEKKLIAWSIAIGLGSCALLVWISRSFF